jgi:hypothetical protein
MPKEWTTAEQKAYLNSHITAYCTARTDGSLQGFWQRVSQGFFEKWPARSATLPGEPHMPLTAEQTTTIQEAIKDQRIVRCY